MSRTTGPGARASLSSATPDQLAPTTAKRLMKEWQAILENPLSSNSNTDVLELRPWDADGEDLTEWFARIRGPDGGAYAGGEFELQIKIPPSYPTRPPKMWFRTRIWHPNVHFKVSSASRDIQQPACVLVLSRVLPLHPIPSSPSSDSPLARPLVPSRNRPQTGEICLDLLTTQWSPAWTLVSLCTAIIALLDAPEPDSPLNVDAANVLRSGDARAYRSVCAMWTRLLADPRKSGG